MNFPKVQIQYFPAPKAVKKAKATPQPEPIKTPTKKEPFVFTRYLDAATFAAKNKIKRKIKKINQWRFEL
jgi:glutamine synthetase adenylyltransferase